MAMQTTDHAGDTVKVVELTDATFDAAVSGDSSPLLVDFWGESCPACRQIAPILSDLAERFAGRLRVATVLAVENPALCARYGVRAMPTVLGLAGGTVVGQLVGGRPRSAFEELAERLLESAR